VLHLIDVDLHLEDDDASSSSQLSKWLARGYLLDAKTSGHGGN